MDVLLDCKRSNSSVAQLEDWEELNPRGSMASSEARAPIDLLFNMHPALLDAWLRLQRSIVSSSSRAPFFDILSPSWIKTDHWLEPTSLDREPATVMSQDTGNNSTVFCLATKMAADRLRHTPLVKTDDHVHWEAMKKFKMLILSDPVATQLGRTFVAGVSLLTDEAEWSRFFSDAFAGANVATLTRRSFALWRFHNWSIENDLGPAVSATESVIYRYMQFLKECGSPTTGSAFLQAWTFLLTMLGV